MMNRILGVAAAAFFLNACADRPTAVDTQANLRASAALVADAPTLCNPCTVGPLEFVRKAGAPVTEAIHFVAGPVSYVVDIDNLASQGAAADVSLNGRLLVTDGIPAHFNGLLTLQSENTLVVRLTGKPGSRLGVAIWRFKPATLEAVSLAPGSVKLDGSAVSFNSTITNNTSAPIPNVSLEMIVMQNAARTFWGTSSVVCGSSPGVLSADPCITSASFHEPASEVGDGTLVPGDALVVIRLLRGGSEVLDSAIVPVVLPTPAPAVIRVSIDPPRLMLLPNMQAQINANVQTVGGAAKTVTWSVIGPSVVTISPTGLVTAVGMGYAAAETWIRATSTVDPSKWTEIPVAVYDFNVRLPSAAVEIGTAASAARPSSIELVATVCGDRAVVLANTPFTRVDFSALSNGVPVFIGTGTPTATDVGESQRCWDWHLTWTPGTAFGLGQQTVYATAFGSPTGTRPLTTLANTRITIVATPPAPAVLGVSIEPRALLLLPRGSAQLTAHVDVVAGAPTTVTWSSWGRPPSQPPGVTVSPEGLVTAVSGAPSFVFATSTADPSKSAAIPVDIYPFFFINPEISLDVATGPSASHPTSIGLQAELCLPMNGSPSNPFARVEFSALRSGIQVPIGTGTVSSQEFGGRLRCWYWSVTWTPGDAFGLGRQSVFATGIGFPPDAATLTTLPNQAITTVAP